MAWQESYEQSVALARQYLARVVSAKNWSPGWEAVGEACILQSEQRTDEAVTFWQALVDTWFLVDETQAPGGWVDLGRTWEAAYYAAWDGETIESNDAGVVAIVQNTVTESAADAGAIADAAVEAADTAVKAAKQPAAWLLALGAFLAWKLR